MTYRMTVVLEYPSERDAPQVNARTRAKDLGDGEVVAIQFSDALREIEVLDEHATERIKDAAFHAANSYRGSSRAPSDHEWDASGKCKWCPAERGAVNGDGKHG